MPISLKPHFKKKIIILQQLTAVALFSGCTGLEKSEKEKLRERNATGEYVYRNHDEVAYPLQEPRKQPTENYPWQEKSR